LLNHQLWISKKSKTYFLWTTTKAKYWTHIQSFNLTKDVQFRTYFKLMGKKEIHFKIAIK
jgi:hypothetical protein